MIKLAMKHFIYELCIDKFFENVFDNFHIFEYDISTFSVGDHFKLKIYYQDSCTNFDRCRVLYKKGKRMVIESHSDKTPPVKIALVGGVIANITIIEQSDYEEYFGA